MNWYRQYKLSGKTYRDDKNFITVYHVSTERLSNLKPFSKFKPYTGIFVSPSYKSIIQDWTSYVIGKKEKSHDLSKRWNETWEEIRLIESGHKIAKNPQDQNKLDNLYSILDKINDAKKRNKDADNIYKTVYIHKISMPKNIYDKCLEIMQGVYESGYMRDQIGFWGWGQQLFIPKEYLPTLTIISVEKMDIDNWKRIYNEMNSGARRSNQKRLKLNPKEEEKFQEEERKIKENELV